MRIIYLSHILNIHDYRFLEKLSSSNHDVLLVAIDNNKIPEPISSIVDLKYVTISRPLPRLNYKYYFSIVSIVLALRHMLYRVIEKSGFLVKLFNKRTLLLHEEFRFLFYREKLSRVINKFNPDVIHAGWIQLDGIVAVLSGFKPILLMPWGSDILRFPFNNKKTMRQTKYVIEKSSHIYCDCEKVKETILEISNFDSNHISVFPNGIDLSLFNPKRTKDSIIKSLGWEGKRIIIMTRSFWPVYGIQFFLMALPNVFNAVSQTRVLIAGSGPLEDELKEIVSSLDLNQYVHFAGFIPNDQLAYYLNSAEIYVSTSKNDGTSLSLLEAMACELPVVVSDVPAICEWIRDGINGYIVPRATVNPISEKIIALLNDRSLANKMGRLNYHIANEKADWNINYSKLENIYQKLVEKKIN